MTNDAFVRHMREALGRIAWQKPEPISVDVYESWVRCLSRGLDPRTPPRDLVDTSTSLVRVREQLADLRRIARVEVDLLHRLIHGSRHAIALSDADGMILDVLHDGGADDLPHAALVRPGTVWSEARCGTNGIGTAAVLGKRLSVLGHQHFFACFAGLACTAAPIFASDGTLAGILDASCDSRIAHPHTQALVFMAAAQVEDALMRDRHRDDIVIAVHPWSEALSMRAAGLVALDRDGVILGLNTQARALLGPACRKGHFGDLFSTSFGDMLVEGRRRDRQQLVTRRGERLQATVETVRALEARAVGATPLPPVSGFVADDPAVAGIARQVDAAARRQLPILIRGATGTGKEQMARHAHAASRRRGAFVPVNCASLPASLVEAELFGYVEGAFTGARRGGSTGLARQADGGTLFLDEIGDMPIALQAVLLRFLDDFMVRPIGGTAAKVDVFLVAATNAGLDQAIAEGRFRMDLLYRLNTLEVTLPGLSERADFPQIVAHLLGKIDAGCAITDGARALLAASPWPGNIRQLRNMLARVSLAARDGVVDETAVAAALGPRSEAAPIDTSLRESQRTRILAAYERAGGNISETSRRLNVSRNTIYRALGKR